MACEDLSVISFSMQGIGTVTWEMPEKIRAMLNGVDEIHQDEVKRMITAHVKGFFCTFSACFYVPSLAPQMLAAISHALDEASDTNIDLLTRS